MNDPILALLLNHWDSLRAGRLAPFRAEINPQAFSPALELTFMLESLGPDDVRFRLAGLRFCDMVGTEVRGKPAVSIMRTESRAQFARILRQVIATPSTVELQLQAQDLHNQHGMGRMLLLPLRSEFGSIDRIIGAVTVQNGHFSPPLGFSISNANITAIKEGIIDSPALPGFAEAQGGFDMHGAPDLRAISGNPTAERGEPRGRFRVIKGGQN